MLWRSPNINKDGLEWLDRYLQSSFGHFAHTFWTTSDISLSLSLCQASVLDHGVWKTSVQHQSNFISQCTIKMVKTDYLLQRLLRIHHKTIYPVHAFEPVVYILVESHCVLKLINTASCSNKYDFSFNCLIALCFVTFYNLIIFSATSTCLTI